MSSLQTNQPIYETPRRPKLKSSMRLLLLFLALTLATPAQQPPFPDNHPIKEDSDPKLPNGKSQIDEMLKAEHEKSLQEADDLIRLAQDLKSDLEKNKAFVVSIPTIKKTEEMERLIKRIRARLKRG